MIVWGSGSGVGRERNDDRLTRDYVRRSHPRSGQCNAGEDRGLWTRRARVTRAGVAAASARGSERITRNPNVVRVRSTCACARLKEVPADLDALRADDTGAHRSIPRTRRPTPHPFTPTQRRHVRRRSSRLAPSGEAPGQPPPRVLARPRRAAHPQEDQGGCARRAHGVQGADRVRGSLLRGPRREGVRLLLCEARRRPRLLRQGKDAEGVRGAAPHTRAARRPTPARQP